MWSDVLIIRTLCLVALIVRAILLLNFKYLKYTNGQNYRLFT